MENLVGRPRSAATGRRHSSSRELVLRAVEAQRSPVSIAALARATGLHENTLRGHLEQLRADGYVARVQQRSACRGRPAWLWRALSAGESSPYAALAGVLAETIARTSSDPGAEARTAGAAWGREIAAELPDVADAEGACRAVLAVMEGQGFAPDPGEETDVENPAGVERRAADGAPAGTGRRAADGAPAGTGRRAADGAAGRLDVALRQCPLLEAASRHPEVVCAVHRGLIDGVLEGVGGVLEVELLPFTGPGTCTLSLAPAHAVRQP